MWLGESHFQRMVENTNPETLANGLFRVQYEYPERVRRGEIVVDEPPEPIEYSELAEDVLDAVGGDVDQIIGQRPIQYQRPIQQQRGIQQEEEKVELINTMQPKAKKADKIPQDPLLQGTSKEFKAKYVNLTTLVSNFTRTGQVCYMNRLATAKFNFIGATRTKQIADLQAKIKNLSSFPPTLDWRASKERLLSTVSSIESLLVIVQGIVEETSGEYKQPFLDFLQGHELPILFGTTLLESQMLWTHLADIEGKLERIVKLDKLGARLHDTPPVKVTKNLYKLGITPEKVTTSEDAKKYINLQKSNMLSDIIDVRQEWEKYKDRGTIQRMAEEITDSGVKFPPERDRGLLLNYYAKSKGLRLVDLDEREIAKLTEEVKAERENLRTQIDLHTTPWTTDHESQRLHIFIDKKNPNYQEDNRERTMAYIAIRLESPRQSLSQTGSCFRLTLDYDTPQLRDKGRTIYDALKIAGDPLLKGTSLWTIRKAQGMPKHLAEFAVRPVGRPPASRPLIGVT